VRCDVLINPEIGGFLFLAPANVASRFARRFYVASLQSFGDFGDAS